MPSLFRITLASSFTSATTLHIVSCTFVVSIICSVSYSKRCIFWDSNNYTIIESTRWQNKQPWWRWMGKDSNDKDGSGVFPAFF